MNKFKASFRFYEAAAPFPGTCLRCGTTSKLWQLGEIPATNMACYYCDRCLVEIASFAGMVTGESFAVLNEVKTERIDMLEAQLSAAPVLLKELSHNVNTILSDFAASMAHVASSALPTNVKASQADTPVLTANNGASAEAGQGTGQGSKPSSKSSGK
jgi:hypothetical protein